MMKAIIYEKKVTGDKFYVKPTKGGYYAVMNRLDHSREALVVSKEDAEKLAAELNGLRR